MPTSILIMTFLTIFTMVLGISKTLLTKRQNTLKRLKTYTDLADGKIVVNKSFIDEVLDSVGVFFNKFFKRKVDKIKNSLNQTQMKMRFESYIVASLILAIVGYLILWQLSKLWYLGFIGLFLGYYLLDIYTMFTISRKSKLLNDQLPDALAIISNGLRAGYSFNQSLSIVSKELEYPIRGEFAKIIRDNSMGMTMEKALTDFSKRVKDDDVEILVTALIIQRKVGGNLAEILDTISDTIRERKTIRGELKTLTAQGRLSAIIISLLPFGIAFFIFLVNPDYILALFRSSIGLMMVGFAIMMQAVGMFIIMKMANIEV